MSDGLGVTNRTLEPVESIDEDGRAELFARGLGAAAATAEGPDFLVAIEAIAIIPRG
jgi:hypothetical protein